MDFIKNNFLRIFPSDPRSEKIGSINFNIFLAQIMGLPYFGLADDQPINRTFLMSYGIVMIMIITFIYTTFELYHLILNWNNLAELAQNACLSLTHFAGLSKILNTLWRMPDLRKSVRKLKLTIRKFVITDMQKEAFHAGELENKLLLSIYATLVGITAIMCIFILIFFPESFAGKKFPFCVHLPQWIPYPVQLVYMGGSVFFMALQIVATDYLNVTLINHIRYQLNILILSFDDFNTLNAVTQANKRLKTIIQHHCSLMEIRNEIETIYRFPILLQFFTSLIIFAMTGFWATVSTEDMNGAALIYLYSGCIFCELFFYCWFGNEVYEKGKSLTTCGFISKWYKFDQQFQYEFLIFLTNANESFRFTAGGFMGLTLPSFAGILSKSYSYIALLRQVYGN